VVFQPRKVQRSGLWEAVEGRVLIYIHKEQMLNDVERRFCPALSHGGRQTANSEGDEECLGRPIDDRMATPGALRARSQVTANYPPAGLTIGCIGDLLNYDLSTLLGASEDRRATLFSDA
jgi:hypothetical protein